MKVVLYGASGTIGSRILNELISRNHEVTAVARHPAKVNAPGVRILAGDVLDASAVAAAAQGADAAISAYSPGGEPEKLLAATKSLISGLSKAGVRRFLMVGGAGSLEVAPGQKLYDSPDFSAAWKAVALAHGDALALLKRSDLDWTNLSPAAYIEPGQRTGTFRLGKDALLVDESGESRISAEDYAVALVNELEHPQHVRQRFTVGY